MEGIAQNADAGMIHRGREQQAGQELEPERVPDALMVLRAMELGSEDASTGAGSEDAEVEYTYGKTKRSLKSGKSTEKATFRGDISEATNTKGWAPTDKEGGYIEYEYDDENNKKAVKITPASDEEFRAMLLEKLIKEETDKASSEAMKTIAERRKD